MTTDASSPRRTAIVRRTPARVLAHRPRPARSPDSPWPPSPAHPRRKPEGRLQPRGPADPGEELLRLPRPGRGAPGQGAAARPPRDGRQASCKSGDVGDRPRRPRRERADRPASPRRTRRSGCRRRKTGNRLDAGRGRHRSGAGSSRGRRTPSTGPSSRPRPGRCPRSKRPGLAAQRHRLLDPRPAGEGGAEALARGRPATRSSAASASTCAACRRRPQEVDAFADDTSPDAYEKAVDRFLDDPAYGERWARIWLDLARYADSAGYGSDPLRHHLALPRLGHRRLQPQPALRPVHHRAARRRPAARARRSSS